MIRFRSSHAVITPHEVLIYELESSPENEDQYSMHLPRICTYQDCTCQEITVRLSHNITVFPDHHKHKSTSDATSSSVEVRAVDFIAKRHDC